MPTEGRTPVITPEEAARIARRWVADSAAAGTSPEARVHEFDLGYVVWAQPGPGGVPLSSAGRGVIDKESGEMTVWPSLPVESVIRQYQQRQARRPPTMFTWDPADQMRWDLDHVATPSNVTHLALSDRVVRARSVKGDEEPRHHRLVVDFMHNVLPPEYRERGYRRCSEAAALSDALHAEDARRHSLGDPLITVEQARTTLFAGASIVTYRVREAGDPVAGASGPPCLSCALLARHFGFQLIPPAGVGESGTAPGAAR
jgi:hypothetical protein